MRTIPNSNPRQYAQKQDISSSRLSLLFSTSVKQHYYKYYITYVIHTTVLTLSYIKVFTSQHTSFKLHSTNSLLSIHLNDTLFGNKLGNTNESLDFKISF